MSRVLAPPSLSTVSVPRFFGQVSDRNGAELNKAEFSTLTNIRNIGLRALKPRKGGLKVFSQTDTNGSKVYGVHTYLDDSLGETYIKASNTRVYKSTGSTWSQIGAVTTFAAATTWFANMKTQDTGAAADTTGTTDAAGHTATSIKKAGANFTPNAYYGKILVINSETKRIIGNDTENIYVAERFDTSTTGLASIAYNVYPASVEFFFANGTDFYKCDATTLTRLDNLTFARGFTGIEAHQGRLYAWQGTRLNWSDSGVGQHFSRNSFKEFATPIIRVKSFGSVLIIYETLRVTAMYGDNPDSFQFVEVLSNVGTTAPKSVENFGDYEFFLSEQYGICVLSLASLTNANGTNEPLSITHDVIQEDIATQSAANIVLACGGVDDGHYHLCIDDDWYVCDVISSFDAPRDENGNVRWLFMKDDRPDAMDANVLGRYGTLFVAGAQDNGQVYQIESGTSDDSTAISWVIEKQHWVIGEYGTLNKFMKFIIRQAAAGSAYTENFFFVPDSTTYGSAVSALALGSVTTQDQKIAITGNPSDKKNTGRTLSYKITGSGIIDVPEIEQVQLLYHPDILR